MPGNKPRTHHWVPQSYLQYFRDPATSEDDPKFWVFDAGKLIKSRKPRRVRISEVFHQRDLYALEGPNGEKDYAIEHLLGDLIDSRYPALVEKIERKEPLNDREHKDLCLFTAAQLMRTPTVMDSFVNFIVQVEEMGVVVSKGAAGQHASEELRRDAENAHRQNLVELIPEIAGILYQMNVAFCCAPLFGPRFITSDEPCFMRNPRLQGQSFYSPGLGQKDVELYLPISPNVLAIFCWSNCRGYLNLSKEWVAENNRMIQGHSNRWFASSSSKASLYWFSRYPLDLGFLLRLMISRFKRSLHRLKIRYGRKR